MSAQKLTKHVAGKQKERPLASSFAIVRSIAFEGKVVIHGGNCIYWNFLFLAGHTTLMR